MQVITGKRKGGGENEDVGLECRYVSIHMVVGIVINTHYMGMPSGVMYQLTRWYENVNYKGEDCKSQIKPLYMELAGQEKLR